MLNLTCPLVVLAVSTVIAPVCPPNDWTPEAAAEVILPSIASIAAWRSLSLYVPSPPTKISAPASTTLVDNGLLLTVLVVGTFPARAESSPEIFDVARVGISVSIRALRVTETTPPVWLTADTSSFVLGLSTYSSPSIASEILKVTEPAPVPLSTVIADVFFVHQQI